MKIKMHWRSPCIACSVSAAWKCQTHSFTRTYDQSWAKSQTFSDFKIKSPYLGDFNIKIINTNYLKIKIIGINVI